MIQKIKVARDKTTLGSSFRDPAGFIFTDQRGQLLRQVNQAGAADFDLLMHSGLYDELIKRQWLVNHKKVKPDQALNKQAYALIKPQKIPFISYPFEWSFSQLKEAALLTLRIQKLALEYGMTLKDASAYNIQFIGVRPILIDTLSFEKYKPGQPWQAYKQFCQHFLAPLALMAYNDVNLLQLLRVQLDGIDLVLANKLLPKRAKIKPGIAMHLALHSKAQKAKAGEHQRSNRQVSQRALLAIIGSLESTVTKLKLSKNKTEWGEYYSHTNYTPKAADQKAKLVTGLAKSLKAKTALDLGGNNGAYSRALNKLGIFTICADIDPVAVESNYVYSLKHEQKDMLPLLIDLTNPGGALGWQNVERETIDHRLKTDIVLALALIHHLAISNNLPFDKIANYFCLFAPYLIIEFVPKADSQVKKLLATRRDIFAEYDEEHFSKAFSKYFREVKKVKIAGTKRSLYLLKRRHG